VEIGGEGWVTLNDASRDGSTIGGNVNEWSKLLDKSEPVYASFREASGIRRDARAKCLS
jgi:hypothetical protein